MHHGDNVGEVAAKHLRESLFDESRQEVFDLLHETLDILDLMHKLCLRGVLKGPHQEVHMLYLQCVHLHVPQVFEDLCEQINVALCMREPMLYCKEVQDGADVLRRPGIVAFFHFFSDYCIEIINVQPRNRIDQREQLHIPTLIFEKQFQSSNQKLELLMSFIERND